MTTRLLLAMLFAAPAIAAAQLCNPVCATQPSKCCLAPESDTFLAEECTGATSQTVHFRVTNGTAWIDQRLPAQFDVSHQNVSVTLGNGGTIQVHIGDSTQSARFQIVDSSLSVIGQCVTTSGNTYSPAVPSPITVDGRALLVSGRNPLYCRATGFPDLLCFGVKGQVGAPFEAGGMCEPDRVEYACGVVS